MRIFTNVFGLMLLISMFSVNAWCEGMENYSGAMQENTQKKMEQSKKEACECCKKCMAAKKSSTIEDEGTPATDGCRDCCERCGNIEKPIMEKIPPEIIEKK